MTYFQTISKSFKTILAFQNVLKKTTTAVTSEQNFDPDVDLNMQLWIRGLCSTHSHNAPLHQVHF
ncbi:hypothetical protein JOB18_032363 [Solea senegalensis]|uniref:Uncharacterized protein n=1 Tax=Solea senegalensis TaxID=28829 RepID=A0AAV6PYE3_SOLSE|nr:hypothetical protein JOB18_032363 [Solea senegalensis]